MSIQLPSSWLTHLANEFEKPYMRQLRNFLAEQKAKGRTIYPALSNLFSAFWETPFDKVKVVILGQDPYHGPNQAHGLSFSVPLGIPKPPSLQNILKELEADLGVSSTKATSGYLLPWAQEGVLLLNSVLSVEAEKAGSHRNQGWELFTDRVIQVLAEQKKHLVFILWGSYAQKKGQFISNTNHCIIRSAHPSPLSAHRGFFGSRPFSQTNTYLQAHGIQPPTWSL